MIKRPATEEDARVAKLALDMYDDFFNQLTTAITNTLANWKGAMYYAQDPKTGLYMRGKVEAFQEFLDRLEKERDLAKQEYQNIVDHESFRLMHESIGFHKNLEVEGLFPDDKYRGSKEYWRIQQLKGRIADLLEGYAQEGFNTGVRYVKQKFLNEKWNGKATKFDRAAVEKMLEETPNLRDL